MALGEQTLANKTILVTGAGSGIGRGIALLCAARGATVVVADDDQTAGESVGEELQDKGLFLATDVSQEESVKRTSEQLLERFGQLDGVVSNAGISGRRYGDGPVHLCSLEAWETIMGTNLRGTFLVLKHTIPALLATRGAVVTLASVLGTVGTQGLFDTHAYTTSKAGIIGLTRSVAVHYARQGLRANAIAPGLIDTVMASRTKSDEALSQQVSFWQPLKPLGEVREVAETAAFLLSDAASFITGAVIPVDGGWSAQ
jgi:NAD(P)-dependent dehydrogenase (short-subunit alcohol dehydrogenase family)